MYTDGREFLKRYGVTAARLRLIEKEYKVQMEQIDSIRNALAGDGIPSGAISSAVEEKAIRLADTAGELKDIECDALLIRQEVFEVIRSVGGEVSEVLYERYINLRPWAEVARVLYFSKSKVYALHRKGLEAVERILNK